MKFAAAALAFATALAALPAMANKLHQEQPTASEVKAWKADQATIKQQEHKKKSKKINKKRHASSNPVKETVGGHQHNK